MWQKRKCTVIKAHCGAWDWCNISSTHFLTQVSFARGNRISIVIWVSSLCCVLFSLFVCTLCFFDVDFLLCICRKSYFQLTRYYQRFNYNILSKARCSLFMLKVPLNRKWLNTVINKDFLSSVTRESTQNCTHISGFIFACIHKFGNQSLKLWYN